jgi:hypothetical protein
LKINLPFSDLETTLSIHIVHLVTAYDFSLCININMPNIQNIIITHNKITSATTNLLLKSHNAITCQIVNIDAANLFLVLPNCHQPVIRNAVYAADSDSNVFEKNQLQVRKIEKSIH